MSCGCLQIPDGAEVLARGTTTYRVVYRVGDYVVKVVKERIGREWIESRARLAAAHSDILEPFAYDLQTHSVRQRYLSIPGTAADVARIKAEISRRNLSIGDVQPHNIRDGKLIDFDEVRPVGGPPLPRGVHRRGKVITIRDATIEELHAANLGNLIRRPQASPPKDRIPNPES